MNQRKKKKEKTMFSKKERERMRKEVAIKDAKKRDVKQKLPMSDEKC